MTTLSTRAKAYGLLSIVFAVLSAFACVALALAALGIGAWVAVDDAGLLGLGLGVGALGLFGAFIGLAFSLVQGVAGMAVLGGRKLGLWLGLGFSVLAVLSGVGGAWGSLLWGAFGLWALWTSRQQFS